MEIKNVREKGAQILHRVFQKERFLLQVPFET